MQDGSMTQVDGLIDALTLLERVVGGLDTVVV